jgi:citrate synthase
MSTTPPSNQYYIRSLEQEIAFFDRKLAHLLNFETFPSQEDRKAAADRLSAKRERMVRTVKQLTEPAQAMTALTSKKKTAAKSKTASKSKAPKLKVAGKAEPSHNELAPSPEPPDDAGLEG